MFFILYVFELVKLEISRYSVYRGFFVFSVNSSFFVFHTSKIKVGLGFVYYVTTQQNLLLTLRKLMQFYFQIL